MSKTGRNGLNDKFVAGAASHQLMTSYSCWAAGLTSIAVPGGATPACCRAASAFAASSTGGCCTDRRSSWGRPATDTVRSLCACFSRTDPGSQLAQLISAASAAHVVSYTKSAAPAWMLVSACRGTKPAPCRATADAVASPPAGCSAVSARSAPRLHGAARGNAAPAANGVNDCSDTSC